MPSQLFAWCTDNANTISIIEPGSKQEWVNFQGVQLRDTEGRSLNVFPFDHFKNLHKRGYGLVACEGDS